MAYLCGVQNLGGLNKCQTPESSFIQYAVGIREKSEKMYL